jgi:phosphoglycerate kinase
MAIRSIRDVKDVQGKRVLVRVDFNVPMKGEHVLDDSRLRAALPTIQYLLGQKASIILVTHLGRPEGKIVAALSIDPIVKNVSELLGVDVQKMEIGTWEETREHLSKMRNGSVTMLENIRFSPDEEKNTGTLAKDLASLADLFVLDGFGVAHRASASVSGVPRHIPGCAGLLLEKEMAGLDHVLEAPEPPFAVVLGGIKMATKIPVMARLLPMVQSMLIGGGIANTYFKAAGYGIGGSVFDPDMLEKALEYCTKEQVTLPVDVVVGTKDGSSHTVVDIGMEPHTICATPDAILDIGPKTTALFEKKIKEARTIVWNGAMGYFECKPYGVGTASVARAIAERSLVGAYSVVGGGETIQSAEALGVAKDMSLVSTGGGAMLEYLSGKMLPGIEALRESCVEK